MANMGDRVNTLVCSFDAQSPRTSAFKVHEWVTTKLGLTEDDLQLLQIDGSKRKIYLKFFSVDKMYAVIQETGGTKEYYHESGEISNVVIELAGMGVRKVRLACLSPESPDSAVRAVLSSYGEVRTVVEERWARPYPLAIPNGIRVVEIHLKKHIPSHVVILGQRVLVSYDGQPFTCFGCNEEGHQFSACPHRRTRRVTSSAGATTWAEKVQLGGPSPQLRMETAGVESGDGMGSCVGGHSSDLARGTPMEDGGSTHRLGGGGMHASFPPDSASSALPPSTVVSGSPPPVGDARSGACEGSGGAHAGGATVTQVRKGGTPWGDDVEIGAAEGEELRAGLGGAGLDPGEWKAAKGGRRRGRGSNGGGGKLEEHGGEEGAVKGGGVDVSPGTVVSAGGDEDMGAAGSGTPARSGSVVEAAMHPPPRQVSPTRTKIRMDQSQSPPRSRAKSRARTPSLFKL
jgi:hypothetical protein